MPIHMLPSNSSPHVSVILVNYNTRDLTLDAISSIQASVQRSGFRVETIVVDNASEDGSADAFERRFPNVCVIRSGENIGYGRGNNLGAGIAAGHALLFLNTDTIVRPHALERLYDSLVSRDDRGVVGPFLENPDGSYQTSMISFPTVWRTFCNFFWIDRLFPNVALFADSQMAHADPSIERDVDVIHGAALMVRRDVFEQLGGFDPEYFMYYEESDLCKRSAMLGYSAHYVPTARVLHLISQSSRLHPWWFFKILRQSRMVYARKHMTPLARFAMAYVVHLAYAVRILIYPVIGIVKPRFRKLGRNVLLSYLHAESPFTTRKNASA